VSPKKIKTAKYNKVALAWYGTVQKQQAIHLSKALLKKNMSYVQECVKISQEGKT
jgi:hypothetical protein